MSALCLFRISSILITNSFFFLCLASSCVAWSDFCGLQSNRKCVYIWRAHWWVTSVSIHMCPSILRDFCLFLLLHLWLYALQPWHWKPVRINFKLAGIWKCVAVDIWTWWFHGPIVTTCQMSHILIQHANVRTLFCDDNFTLLALPSSLLNKCAFHFIHKLFSTVHRLNGSKNSQNAYLEWIRRLIGHLVMSFNLVRRGEKKAYFARSRHSNGRWWLIAKIQFVDIVFQFPAEIPIWWRSSSFH